ncbi:site-2 protease family protein [Streptomyces spirodelae]|uniref:Zinc metalloprotease n=1 Tax=Streptomyces spirodelae TaxID=2812904 RepID=A0ABS3WQB9_9ACTN|nr:site-2 protease family protein [Streptomyces spirodelae]MBO8185214.1 site-2 protease family protein [Streptomyces spirodelae]
MRATLPLGRIAGVRIGVHWSVLLVFALVAWILARSRFPQVDPGRAEALYWVIALGTAVLFFSSLLAHELAHAVVARRNDVPVEDITLWLLGGLARLKSEASQPGAELRIAGVGPLVSLLLGVGFGLCSWLVHLLGAPRLVVEAVAWLAVINVLLALFNAIPAAPLDGGRLLRAVLWWRTGDRLRAAIGATLAGRAFGWLLIVGGLLLFLATRVFDGLWLALIGWFLLSAATAEGRQAQLRSTLAGVPVRRAMTEQPVTVSAELTVSGFLSDARYRYRHSAFPVVDPVGEAVGLMTLERAQHVRTDQRETTEVGEVMLPLAEAVTVAPDDLLPDLLPRMESGAEHRAIVLDGGRVVGIVAPSDIARTLNWLMPPQPRWGSR